MDCLCFLWSLLISHRPHCILIQELQFITIVPVPLNIVHTLIYNDDLHFAAGNSVVCSIKR
ncbi:hypothetical protein KC19_1G105400 [Ceratodon purpureus]|uniref:Uncharacterized protein n=1 Tax=Ceratodon purpureus TaxID=3225 RepID=A0A8T0J6I6_CERPU|nr:hypothetical protein KC19_1G105400 [Ceratodon purpureus]